MKGVIFRSFLAHVENRYGADQLETMISSVDLSTDAAYTSIGTYDPGELVGMLVVLSQSVEQDVPTLVRDFGESLFPALMAAYPSVVQHSTDAFSLIASIDNYIHVEVKKLYPDAELPKFTCERENTHLMRLTYESSRGFADLAEGLLRACFRYFDEEAEVKRFDQSDGAGTTVLFLLELKGKADG